MQNEIIIIIVTKIIRFGPAGFIGTVAHFSTVNAGVRSCILLGPFAIELLNCYKCYNEVASHFQDQYVLQQMILIQDLDWYRNK